MNNFRNLAEIERIGPDYIGFIFYEKSSRSVQKGDLTAELVRKVKAKKVGVFVNQSLDEVSSTIEKFDLGYVQLHGDESVEFCWEIKSLGASVVKAFSVKESLPVEQMRAYEGVIDLFLLDTSGSKYGGNGVKFDWNILEDYPFTIPFLLSGGIEPGDEILLKNLKLEQLYGYDINSRFEVSPGIKNEKLVEEFINSIRV